MTERTLTVELTKPEAVALRRASAFVADSFEVAGIDLAHVCPPNGRIGVSPLVAGVAKLELLLMLEGVEI